MMIFEYFGCLSLSLFWVVMMSSLRNRSNRLKPKSKVAPLSFLTALVLLVLPTLTPVAQATGPQLTVGMYLDQPFVQGSYVAEDYPSDSAVTTFNNQNYVDACQFEGGTIEPLYSESADCHVQTIIHYGGASTTSSTPVAGQYPSSLNYGQVGSGGASIVFDTPQTYFGLWWSAGSVGNEIQLFDGTDLVANTSANDVATTLYNTSTITSLNGDDYATRLYIGNPVDWYTVGTPTDFSDQDSSNSYQSHYTLAQEPFVFIHFIAENGVTFDRVNLIAPGNGFEFDNFTVSDSTNIRSAGLPNRLVLQRQIYQPTYVDFDANGGTGAVPRQYSLDNQSGYLQSSCLNYYDPNLCINTPNNSYATSLTSWNTSPDGSGTSYELGSLYPFTESTTLYAQWKTDFYFYNLTNPDANGSNAWDYVDWDSATGSTAYNFANFTLPSPVRAGYYLEGWYGYDSSYTNLVRIGGPGQVYSSATYTTWDNNIFGRWLEGTPPTTLDAATPDLLLVYPNATTVTLPNLPLIGDVEASVCLIESDSSGNEISSNLQFASLSTATSGFTTSFDISAQSALVSNNSRYLRVTIAPASDTTCSTGQQHVIELRPAGATLTQIIPLSLTDR
jgi:hypothetical protein